MSICTTTQMSPIILYGNKLLRPTKSHFHIPCWIHDVHGNNLFQIASISIAIPQNVKISSTQTLKSAINNKANIHSTHMTHRPAILSVPDTNQHTSILPPNSMRQRPQLHGILYSTMITLSSPTTKEFAAASNKSA